MKSGKDQEKQSTCKCCCTPCGASESNGSVKKGKTWLITLLTIVALIVLTVAVAFIVDSWDGVVAVGNFISDQVLGMKWLNNLIGSALSALFGESFLQNHWGGALQFFLYDTIKIVVLLCILIFTISYVQSYFPPERTRRILGQRRGIFANIIGALLGTVTPFCSCSSIPIFMGFTRAGLSSGVTFSFLISSPLVDLGAFILLAGIFGFPIAIAYVFVGLVLAVIGGTIIEKTGLGNYVQDYIKEGTIAEVESMQLTVRDRLLYSKDQMLSTLRKVWVYILIGVAIGATIHNFIPSQWIEAVLGQDKWYSVLVASVVGVPMYADIFGTIPIAEALFGKGVGLGTILAFMMSVTALSLPSMIMLSKAVKPRLLAWFIVIVVIGIIAIGYIFNAVGFLFV